MQAKRNGQRQAKAHGVAMMKTEYIKEMVDRVVGPIDPVGAEHLDCDRYENLVQMCRLVDRIMYDIGIVAQYNENCIESSRQKAGKKARRFLTAIKECD
jgi:hypothetical protein